MESFNGKIAVVTGDATRRDVLRRSAEALTPTLAAFRRVRPEFPSGPASPETPRPVAPAEPLDGVTLTVEDLAAGLGTTTHFVRPVAIEGQGVVRGGYALSVADGVHVYGLVDHASRVTVAGVHRTGIADVPVAEAFADLARTRGLHLVDWRGGLRTDDAGVLAEELLRSREPVVPEIAAEQSPDPSTVKVEQVPIAPLAVQVEIVAAPQGTLPGLPPLPPDILELEGRLQALTKAVEDLEALTHPALQPAREAVDAALRQREELDRDLKANTPPLTAEQQARLLEGVGDLKLEQLRAVEAPGVAHLKYRVVR